MKPSLQAVAHLGRFERLQLVEDLWDDFAAETGMNNNRTDWVAISCACSPSL